MSLKTFNPDLKILSCCDNVRTVLLDRLQKTLIASSLSISGEGKHCPQVLVKPPTSGCTRVCCQLQIKALQMKSNHMACSWQGLCLALPKEITLMCWRPQWCRDRVAGGAPLRVQEKHTLAGKTCEMS